MGEIKQNVHQLKNKELYNGDHMKNEIIWFYQELYQSCKKRNELKREDFLVK